MQRAPSNWFSCVRAVLAKEALTEFRARYAFSTLTMFALVTLASISMSIAGAELSAALAAVLLWVILFFCAMAGLARTFVQEQEAGTLFALRLYARGQAVLAGKLLFNILLLQAVAALVVPLYAVLLNVEIALWGQLATVLALGTVGIAAVATLTALMIARTGAKGSLFTVISFPVLLPQFLTAVMATSRVLDGTGPTLAEYGFLAGYDIAMIAAASLLFDYLWYD